MTDPKERRFTADEMEEYIAGEMEGMFPARRAIAIIRQAASDLRERERIMAALECKSGCRLDPDPRRDCPACAIRRGAGLEES